MTNSNMPEGKVAVMLTQEQLTFLMDNANTNVKQIRAKVLELAIRDDVDEFRDIIVKLDSLKKQFEDVLIPLREAGND